jgi:hypothetical protein
MLFFAHNDRPARSVRAKLDEMSVLPPALANSVTHYAKVTAAQDIAVEARLSTAKA